MSNKWHRFRPRVRGSINDPTAYEPDSLYAAARRIAEETLRSAKPRFGRGDVYQLTSEAVKRLAGREPHDPEHLLALLILQSPSAARAQREMDEHHGGYRNREARLFELIDFNDMFVETVLAIDSSELAQFSNRAREEIDRFCAQQHVASFTDRQYEAISHGLSREIAVYRAARQIGYIAHMTSRVQDAMGIDMVITDPESKKSINIDVKTHSAYHFRLLELQHQHRMDETKRYQCEQAGFCTVVNGHGDNAVHTVLLRVATDRLGEIENFQFVDTGPIATLLSEALHSYGRHIY